MKYPYVVVIDEVGYGYSHPCYSWEEAMREAKKLQTQGYKVKIIQLQK